jgi:hypothetical protein
MCLHGLGKDGLRSTAQVQHRGLPAEQVLRPLTGGDGQRHRGGAQDVSLAGLPRRGGRRLAPTAFPCAAL